MSDTDHLPDPLPSRPTPPPAPQFSPRTPLPPLLDAWLAARRKEGLATNTLKAFQADMNILVEFVGDTRPVGVINTTQLEDYLNWMRYDRGRDCSDKTYDRRITTLKSFFRWATPAAQLAADPAAAIVNVSVRSPLPDILSEEELHRALAAADRIRLDGSALPAKKRGTRKPDLRPFMLFVLTLHTCLRKGEIAALRTEHIHPHGELPHLYVRYKDSRHRNKERRLPLPPDFVETWDDYRVEHGITDLVFPWSVRRLEYLLADIVTAAELNKPLSFDTLRWTGAVEDYRAGMPPAEQKRKLGLSDVQWGETLRKLRTLAGDDTTPTD